MTKKETLEQWRNLPENVNPLKYMKPIAYKSRGSSFGACGVRIDGNPQFVEAVLGKLKELMAGENAVTRLELSRHEAATGFKETPKADDRAEVCYIRLHMRGNEAAMVSAVFDRHLQKKTVEYANAIGVKTDDLF